MATTRLSAARSMVMINMIAVMSLDSLEARCSAGKKDVQTTRQLVGHLGRWPDRPLYRPLYRSRAGAIGRQEVRHEGHSRNLPPPRRAPPRAGQAASYRGETHQASGPCSTKAGMPPACWTGSPPGFGKKVVQLTRNVGSSAPRSVARLLSRSAVVSTAVSLARW